MGRLRHPKVLPHAAASSAARSFLSCAAPTRGKHFYSSSESEEEEEAHKKFNIKIKPLQAKDILKSAATVDELKASVGNIALSPSPVVSAPCLFFFFFLGCGSRAAWCASARGASSLGVSGERWLCALLSGVCLVQSSTVGLSG